MLTNAITNGSSPTDVRLITYIQIGPIGMTPFQWLMLIGGIVMGAFLIIWFFARTKD